MIFYKNSFNKQLILILVVIFISIVINSCGILVSTIIPFKDLPVTNGKYDIGTKIFTWEDSTRLEWFTEEIDDYRKIVVQIWYPAINISGMPMPYLDQWERRIGPIADQIDIPSILIRSIKNVQSNSYLNAEIKNTNIPYPLIVFSHGLGGMRMQNSIQMETLANAGYVVIAIDHAYDANITLFDDGSVAEYRSGAEDNITVQEFWALRTPQINTRAADVSYVIDKIESFQEKDRYFWNFINLESVGVLGHSFGGATGIVTSYKDNRIDACIALDGWIVPIESSIIQNGMHIPFLYMGREKWDTPLNYLKLDSLLAASSASIEKIILFGTKHFDYSDTPQFTSMADMFGVSGSMPTKEIRDTLNVSILKFFNTYLVDR